MVRKSIMESVVNDDWRTTKETLQDRQEFLLNNEFGSDIRFSLSNVNGDEIFAHKFPLMVNSPVFAAMFHGPLATQEEVINISDCDDKETFLTFFKYLYCERCQLNWENVLDILYLAKKYLVSGLVKECTKYLSQDINIENALIILQQATKFEEKELQQKCVTYICSHTKPILNTEYFAELDIESLKVILRQDGLNVKETEIFNSVVRWCEHRLDVEQNSPLDPTAKRKLLGDALQLIRFPIMTAKEFAEDCVQSGLLTTKESCDVLCYLVRKTGFADEDGRFASEFILPHGFSVKQRAWQDVILKSACRKIKNTYDGWAYSKGSVDAIGFVVDKTVKLWGITVFGNPYEHIVKQLYIQEGEKRTDIQILKPDQTGNLVNKKRSTLSDSFEIFFQNAITVFPGRTYYICAEISGPRSKYASYPIQRTSVDGINFDFVDAQTMIKSSNGTSVGSGQFPEFWFE